MTVHKRSHGGFTLIELLVSITIIALLIGILLPSLGSARQAARSAVCASGARQLQTANTMHANDQDESFAPGASDMLSNLDRWHGTRASTNEMFAPTGGPLTPYLGEAAGEALRECPSFAQRLAALAELGTGFERGCGGYGYNNAYVGSRIVATNGRSLSRSARDDRRGQRVSVFDNPSQTVAFTDAAFSGGSFAGEPSTGPIEYSFVEPRFHPGQTSFRADPSIHFRHTSETANVAWLDTHVSAEHMTKTWSSGFYGPLEPRDRLGWFGKSDSNALFDTR